MRTSSMACSPPRSESCSRQALPPKYLPHPSALRVKDLQSYKGRAFPRVMPMGPLLPGCCPESKFVLQCSMALSVSAGCSLDCLGVIT